MADWSFITNHGAVLAIIAQNKTIKATDIAILLEITERSVRRVIADLCEAGYITKTYKGGVNHYKINPDMPLRRRIQQSVKVRNLLTGLGLNCD
jgi:DeoR/GlpR family transcriptional regulator of sugar metabolism